MESTGLKEPAYKRRKVNSAGNDVGEMQSAGNDVGEMQSTGVVLNPPPAPAPKPDDVKYDPTASMTNTNAATDVPKPDGIMAGADVDFGKERKEEMQQERVRL